MLSGIYAECEWFDDERGLHLEKISGNWAGGDHGDQLNEWRYLQLPRETGPHKAVFYFVCDEAFPEFRNGSFCGDWRCLDASMTIDDVWEYGVVMLTEVARFESDALEKREEPTVERPLATKERNSLLAIIGLLADQCSVDLRATSKAAQIIESSANLKGIRLSRRTIEEHLKKVPQAIDHLSQ